MSACVILSEQADGKAAILQKKRGAASGMKIQRRKKRLRFQWVRYLVLLMLIVTAVIKIGQFSSEQGTTTAIVTEPNLDVELLTVNSYSRPGIPLKQVNGIVIHYTANPGSTAMQNRDYFEGLKDSHATKASSHFIIGLNGEIVQCIPTKEISYASNNRNTDTISIECCHPTSEGKFNQATYDSLVHLTAWLCGRFGLTSDDVIRHYDITGKMCPLYYVEHENAWKNLKQDVEDYMEKYGKTEGKNG